MKQEKDIVPNVLIITTEILVSKENYYIHIRSNSLVLSLK